MSFVIHLTLLARAFFYRFCGINKSRKEILLIASYQRVSGAMQMNSGKRTFMTQRKTRENKGNFSGGRFVLSAVVLSLLLLVYFGAPMAFANAEAGGSGSAASVQYQADEGAGESSSGSGTEETGGSGDDENTETSTNVSTDYDLNLICGVGQWGVYWDSREDYNTGLLSIDYRLENRGTGTAYSVNVVSATANQGVTVDTALPLSLGDIVGGGWKYFTLKWLVPNGVSYFKTDVQACVDCEEEDEGAGEDEPGDEPGDDDSDDESGDDDSDDDEPGDDDDSDGDDQDNGNGNGNQDNGNGNGNGNQGDNPLIDDPPALEEDPPKNEGGNDNETPVTGGTGDNVVNGGGSSNQPATSLYRDALPNTGAGLLADVFLGMALGLLGLLGLWVSLRVAGTRRQ